MARRLRAALLGILAFALSLTPWIVRGQDAPADDARIVALEAREPAPYAGMLLPDDVAVGWRQEIERLRFELDLAAQREVARTQAHAAEIEVRETAARERLALHDQIWSERAAELRAAAEDARKERDRAIRNQGPRWWQRPGLWFVIGAAAGATVTGLVLGR